MVQRRMYVIGGLGAVAGHEGFGPDYVLPNNGYLETCAAIGAGFFHHNMNLALADARYADELERVLYNAVLPGVSLKGDTYFYENPLEAGPKRARWAWHGCPCCPPMFLKIMGALPGYIYAQDADAVYVNLFVGSQANLTRQRRQGRAPANHPLSVGRRVKLSVEPERDTEFALNVRLPGWCAEPTAAGERQAAGDRSRTSAATPASSGSGSAAMSSNSPCPCPCNASRPIRRSRPTSAAWRSSAGRWSIASKRWTTAATCGTWSSRRKRSSRRSTARTCSAA